MSRTKTRTKRSKRRTNRQGKDLPGKKPRGHRPRKILKKDSRDAAKAMNAAWVAEKGRPVPADKGRSAEWAAFARQFRLENEVYRTVRGTVASGQPPIHQPTTILLRPGNRQPWELAFIETPQVGHKTETHYEATTESGKSAVSSDGNTWTGHKVPKKVSAKAQRHAAGRTV